ncbi:MAG TPA: coenzyme F420-0:L-glutamate ligase [Nocardioidaceae bacterium]|nr:coenzyme F420-0:L-glutamate ligase [Nocardioidaceae bacterium]
MSDRLEVVPVRGIAEISAGDDLATQIHEALPEPLRDGDVVAVTSKIVSKAAGLTFDGVRDTLLDKHTVRTVARRGNTRIVRTTHGLTMAAAGLDASNTAPGSVVALPPDPDADAARLRDQLGRLSGANVAVIVTDTAGRPWRQGQTDIAIGAAGLATIDDLADALDSHGNRLVVTAPAVADEIAGAADLVQGKTLGVPVAVVRGVAERVLPPGRHGDGAAALVRPAEADLFGWGSADAVRAAVRRDDPEADRGFPVPDDSVDDMVADALEAADPTLVELRPLAPGQWQVAAVDRAEREAAAWEAGGLVERLRALAVATRRRIEVRHDRSEPSALARVTITPE